MKKIPCEICKLIIHDKLQETENVINSHGIYIYHFKEEFPAAYDFDKDPGIVAVDRIHRSIKISKQGKVEQGIADLMAFLNSRFTFRLNCPNLHSTSTNKCFAFVEKRKASNRFLTRYMITSDSDLILNFKNDKFLIASLDMKPT